MRYWIVAIAVVVATAVGGSVFPTAPVMAQTAAKDIPIVIGTLDWQEIQTQSKAGKSLRTTLQKRGKELNQEIAKKEQAIRAKLDQLQQQRSALPAADYEAKRKQLDKEFEALRKEAGTKQKALEKARNAGFEQILKALDSVVRDVADKRGLTLVLHRSAVVLGAEDWDITEEVKKALDAKLPAVKI